ncbi:hypothetical protein Q6350_11040 [Isoptericola sp. b515]|uniref:hypothetical protein n=1 Tax=Isoptericola sp. b515 TaxID=3064652 RepID=UPI00271332DE|nr:hypothetical protein [Isoptericola sp. b515]MDO8148966.1 hypothetical protein [Isoptericola sp. b515]
MVDAARSRRGFWSTVGRPFRALGRAVGRLVELLDLLWLPVQVVRGAVWLVRGAGRLIGEVFGG